MKLPALSRRALALISLVSALVLFVSVNVIADRYLGSIRIDLTQNGLYTLSDGTRKTLAEIQEPITLRFYFSKQLGDEVPSYGIYAQRVRETLEEYSALANGKINLQVIDPEPFSPEEDRAVALGLQGVPLEQGGEKVYFGLAAGNSTDDQELISFFQPDRERFLEYDLTKVIHAVATPKKTVVGVLSSLPLEGDFAAALQGQPLRPYAIMTQLQQLYEMRTLSTDVDKIDPDVDVLMIVHPQNLPPKTLYAIDQYVLRGGRALVFVDPYSETQQLHPNQFAPPGAGTSSDLEPVFKAWGVTLVPGMVVGDRNAARRVNAGSSANQRPVDYVAWLALKSDALTRDDLITGDLDQVNMATSGILEPVPDAKTKLIPLIQTSTDSEQIPVAKVEGLPDVAGLLRDFKSSGKRMILAARVTGSAATAFPDGPPKPEPKPPGAAGQKDEPQPDAASQLKESVQPINVVVVADTDILEDRFWAQTQDFFGQQVVVPTASNGDFVANAIEVLAGGNALINLRSRGTAARPFVLVNAIQKAAQERYEATAKALQDKLTDTENKIKDIQENKEGAVTLTADQSQAIENFRSEMLRTRQQLRLVQRQLREDVDRLKEWLEFWDIAAVPIVVGVAAVVLGWIRLNRRKRPTVHA